MYQSQLSRWDQATKNEWDVRSTRSINSREVWLRTWTSLANKILLPRRWARTHFNYFTGRSTWGYEHWGFSFSQTDCSLKLIRGFELVWVESQWEYVICWVTQPVLTFHKALLEKKLDHQNKCWSFRENESSSYVSSLGQKCIGEWDN